jgi:hypothetical protein
VVLLLAVVVLVAEAELGLLVPLPLVVVPLAMGAVLAAVVLLRARTVVVDFAFAEQKG